MSFYKKSRRSNLFGLKQRDRHVPLLVGFNKPGRTDRIPNLERYVATLLAMTALLISSGCQKYYYNPAPQLLPSYIRKIAVRPFANHTQQYGLEDKLTLAVQTQFNQDGRYQITTEDQADGVLIGDITRYILEPLSYDANHVPTQYKMWILVDITFYDKIKNQTLFKESNMDGELRYYVDSSGLPGAMTEEEARQTIWDQLSRDILTRTLEGFGTVTGTSDKAVPKSAPTTEDTLGVNGGPSSNAAPPAPSSIPAPASPSPIPY